MPAAPNLPHLANDEVRVYATEIRAPSPASILRLAACLSMDERMRADRFMFDRDRHVFIAAHALLRHVLGVALGDHALRFRIERYGKPELDGMFDGAVRFNLSHTHGMAVCAVCRHYPVGIDVEAIDRNVDVEALARRFFAPAEYDRIAAAAPAARGEIFFRLWTLKEAIIKAIGDGLSLPLKDFAFTLDPLSLTIAPQHGEDASSWHVAEYTPTATHRMALALRRPPGAKLNVIFEALELDRLAEKDPRQNGG
jgi:4'-phosphopantetheinyl transferase